VEHLGFTGLNVVEKCLAGADEAKLIFNSSYLIQVEVQSADPQEASTTIS
jgi:hypothetical protein